MPERGRPEASVIIPVYRHWQDLRRCLDALADQTVPADRFEILVVNNDPQIPPPADLALPANARLLEEARKGSYAARNRALEEAAGEILCFTDSDCVPERDWLERLITGLRERPGTGRVGGAIRILDDADVSETVLAYERIFSLRQDSYVAEKGYAATANMAAWRSTFDAVGPFDAALFSNGDREWGERAGAQGIAIAYLDDAVVGHPPRRSFAEIFRKHRRVAGGATALKERRRGGAMMRLRFVLGLPLVLIPSTSKTLMILRRRDIALGIRARLVGVIYAMRYVRVSERFRILFLGAAAERR